jgi:tripartite ATP-independent transporter DctM subunit
MEITNILVISMFATFILFLFSGFPIAFVLAGVGVLFTGVGYLTDQYLNSTTGLDFLTLGLLVNRIFHLMSNWVLIALPMFIYMGLMLDRSQLAKKLLQSSQNLFGTLHGGLALTVTIIGTILAASTGIIGASIVLLGTLSLESMLKQNYSKELAVGTICSAGTLGIIIPPSIMLVIMADQLSLSVGDLFMGAVFPGVLLALLYFTYIVSVGFLKPSKAPLPKNVTPLTMNTILVILKDVFPPLFLVFTVLGSIFAGLATPTEASGIGAIGATLLAWNTKKLSIKVIEEVLQETLKTTSFIFAIFIGASCFSLVLRELGGDEFISNALNSLPFGPYGILSCILLTVFILGFFLDWIEITLIILPLTVPVIENLPFEMHSQIDHPGLLWFTVLIAITLQTSFLTPPVGFAIFYLKGIAPPEIKLSHIYRGNIPFILLQLLALLIIIYFPDLVLWLPSIYYQ